MVVLKWCIVETSGGSVLLVEEVISGGAVEVTVLEVK